MKKILVLAAVAMASILGSEAATVGWSTGTRALGLSTGTEALQGSLVRLGYFTVSNATVQSLAAAGNKAGLDAAFQQFGTTTVGNGGPFGTGPFFSNGLWDDSEVLVNPTFTGNRVYMWALNAATLGAATQWGIFTNPVSAAWVFPSDSPVPGVTTIELGQVPQDSTGLIVGSYGGGPDAFFNQPLYEMADISAVPEPSTFAFGALVGAVGLCSVVRRRRQQRA